MVSLLEYFENGLETRNSKHIFLLECMRRRLIDVRSNDIHADFHVLFGIKIFNSIQDSILRRVQEGYLFVLELCW